MQTDITAARERFCTILRSTQIDNIDDIINYLDELGFFDAPASVRNHFNFAGGLLLHSLNVYDVAMRLREDMIAMRPDCEPMLQPESIAIAALLHDVCKADIYRQVKRKQKNEIGIWEEIQTYDVDYSNLPAGHGEKSVMMLLRAGLDLEDDELLAIRWHMAPWDLATQSIEMDRSYRTALKKTPLVSLIHNADSLAAHIIESDGFTLG